MLPSWMRSRNDIPRPMYFLAIETTSRRLASVSRRLGSNPGPGGPVGGLAPALCGGCVEQVLELAQVGKAQQLLRDVRLLALALDRGQALDDVGQHLLDGALARVDLLEDVQRLEGVVERLGLDGLRKLDLVVGREQAHAPNLLEVHADGVVQRDRIHHLDVEQHLVIDLLDLFEVLLSVRDLDADLFERGEDPEDLVRLGVDLGEALQDVVRSEVALLLALDDQLFGHGHQLVFEPMLRLLDGLSGPVSTLGRYFGCARDRHPLLSISSMAWPSSLASASSRATRSESFPLSASESSRIIPLWRLLMWSSVMRSASSTATSSSTLGGGAAQALLIRSCSSAGYPANSVSSPDTPPRSYVSNIRSYIPRSSSSNSSRVIFVRTRSNATGRTARSCSRYLPTVIFFPVGEVSKPFLPTL